MRVESNKKYSKNKVTILLIIAVAALTFIVGGYTIYARSQSIWPFAITQSQDSQESTNNSNTSQPSNTTDPTYSGEKNNTTNTEGSNDGKSTLPSKSDSSATKPEVQVGISSAGRQGSNVEVRAFISGAIEGSGTCTAIFTKDSITLHSTSNAFIDASTSQCEPIILNGSEFEPGVWSLLVNYESTSHIGKSATMEVSL